MSKRAPSTTQLLVIAGFALSCFGILLFLWITFGGPTPFKAKPYEIKVPFNEATQLAEQSDVRISGVNVGKVQNIALAPNGKQALATVDIDDKYAPLPESTRAILRTKTLLGETYVELTPGDRDGPEARRRRHPARGQRRRIGPARRDLPHLRPARPAPPSRTGCRKRAVAIDGQGQSLSYALRRARTDLHRIRQALPRARHASGSRSSSSSATAPPPSRRCAAAKASWPSLIQNSNAVFQTTAAPRPRHRSALPRLPDLPGRVEADPRTGSKPSPLNADPLMRQLVPAAEQLSPTLIAFAKLAPEAKGFFEGLATGDRPRPDRLPGPAQALPRRFPAAAARRRSLPAQPQPDPHRPRPLQARDHRVRSANVAAATNGELTDRKRSGEQIHYLRAMGPLNPESLATYPSRLTTNRNSAYSPAAVGQGPRRGPAQLRHPPVQLRASPRPSTPNTPNNAAFKERTKKGDAKEADRLLQTPEEIRLRRTDQHRLASPPRPAPSRRPSRRSTAAARRRPTSTPSNSRRKRRQTPRMPGASDGCHAQVARGAMTGSPRVARLDETGQPKVRSQGSCASRSVLTIAPESVAVIASVVQPARRIARAPRHAGGVCRD